MPKQDLVVKASPTKKFFVDMLTRDIDLDDAILDLLDNCVDGIMRASSASEKKRPKPYDGYWARIHLSKAEFRIEDNCGGIPRETAKTVAFRMGKPADEPNEKLPTVGLYGIGMKRAIFKMGRDATVRSRTASEAFEVAIAADWLDNDGSWDLALKDLPTDGTVGTTITVKKLREEVADTRSETASFIEEFKRKLGTHYSFIIHKGFQVKVNDVDITPAPLRFLMARDLKGDAIAPYVYDGTISGVKIRMAVGLLRPTPSEDELDEEQEARRTSETAGWTVICNDRVVVYCDKSRLTGWGEANIPSFHSQFIGISGIVEFSSPMVSLLPLTTTKRGLNTSSDLYLRVKNQMRDGMKHFTTYTYKWKRDPQGEKSHYKGTESATFEEVIGNVPETAWKAIAEKDGEVARKFVPKLPVPKTGSDDKVIRFSRPLKAIRKVAKFLTGDADTSPSEVGQRAFDDALKQAKQ
jgi:hypothetical protein